MNEKLICNIPAQSIQYEIEVKAGLLQEVSKMTPFGSKFAIICDDTTKEAFGTKLKEALDSKGCTATLFSFAHGEASKNRRTKEAIEDQMFQAGFGRDVCVIGLGGGVVLDLAGFVASTFCRGVPLLLMPTTLLAMSDASIGGKNGVDIPQGKNLVGCIYQPAKIFIDTNCLTSLPLREKKNGLVEMIKHGLIHDKAYFEMLERAGPAIFESPSLIDAISRSCAIKLEIVVSDEKENGRRRLLNFGHTIGHAIEQASNFSLAHGEAVAIGCVAEAYMAMQLGHLSKAAFDAIENAFRKFELPFTLPKTCTPDALLETMSFDKKALLQNPRFVILNGIGSALSFDGVYCTKVDKELLQNTLSWMIHDLCRH